MLKKFFLILLVLALGIEASAITSGGRCGDNITWSFNSSSGVLTLTGFGRMWDYYGYHEAPWDDYITKDVKKIVFDDAITYIGKFAFSYCNKCTTIQLPQSLEEIGAEAFLSCKSLTEIVLPSSVKYVHYKAFIGHKALRKLILNDGLEYIGSYAFSGGSITSAPTITSVTIPSTVKYIGAGAMQVNSSSFILNEGVRSIQKGAFFDTRTTTMEIPNSVIELGKNVFSHCTKLKEITIGTGIKRIDSFCFSDPALKMITIKNGNPPVITNTIFGANNDHQVKICVPSCDNVNNYLAAPVWQDFYDYVTYAGDDAYCGENDEFYPTNIQHRLNGTELYIYWDNMSDADYYEIEMLSGNITIFQGIKTTNTNSLLVDLSHLSGNQRFAYRIRSVNSSEERSDWNYGEFWDKIEKSSGDVLPPDGSTLTCSDAAYHTNQLEHNTPTSQTYTVIGYVTSTDGVVSQGQQTFWMADTKDGGNVFEIYLGNVAEKMIIGDYVSCIGHLTRYDNICEMKNPDVSLISRSQEAGVEEVAEYTNTPTKFLRDGQILILRGEKVYTVTGQEVR